MKIKEFLREKESGFTLVELLVVIVIIGILATGILVALNPIEQIRRGRDTAAQAAAREFLGASERYYGMHNEYPDSTADGGNWDEDLAFDIDDATVQPLIEAKELRDGFANRGVIEDAGTEDGLKAYIDKDSEEMRVCFMPQSDAFSEDADCVDALDACDDDTGDWFCVPGSTN